jgi:hypothetical protein
VKKSFKTTWRRHFSSGMQSIASDKHNFQREHLRKTNKLQEMQEDIKAMQYFSLAEIKKYNRTFLFETSKDIA